MDVERILFQLARENDGIITRHEAIRRGCSPSSLDRRLASGLLIRVLPCVYRLASQPDTYRARVRAASLWGDGALLAGGTVLALKGLEGFDEAPIELYLPSGKSVTGIRTRRPPSYELRSRPIDRMPATTIERALLDACANHSAIKVGKAMDDALRRRLTTLDRLKAAIPPDSRGVKGAKAFARLVAGRDLNDQRVRSDMETRMLRILRRIKGHRFIPDFEVQGRKRYFLDFAFPNVLLGIECHSRRWHGPGRADADLARHRDLQRLGWTILYFSWDDVVFRPEQVQSEIEEFLGLVARD